MESVGYGRIQPMMPQIAKNYVAAAYAADDPGIEEYGIWIRNGESDRDSVGLTNAFDADDNAPSSHRHRVLAPQESGAFTVVQPFIWQGTRLLPEGDTRTLYSCLARGD